MRNAKNRIYLDLFPWFGPELTKAQSANDSEAERSAWRRADNEWAELTRIPLNRPDDWLRAGIDAGIPPADVRKVGFDAIVDAIWVFARQTKAATEKPNSKMPTQAQLQAIRSTSRKRFEIALTFPGEHRDSVDKVAEHLSAQVGRDRVLYDKYHEAEFARINLDVYLPRLYREESELVVVFLCPEYRQKRWCNLEWRHIRQLITTADEDRIMLTSFGSPDDLSDIGILSGDGYVDIGLRDPATIANLILQRSNGTPTSATNPGPADSTAAAPANPHSAVALWQEN